MYLRFSQRANADGTLVRYVALAHNRRVDGKAKPDVLMNLGRVDRLDVDGLLRLAASIRKHFGDGGGLTDSAEAGLAAGAAPMAVADARPIGTAWLLDALWTRLEIGTSIKRITDGRRFTTAVERVLFALVCNRAIAPMSKLGAAEWATEDVVIPGPAGMVDVGGGNGALLAALLREHPALRGTVLDLPGAAEAARKALTTAGLADRSDAVAGSFFDPLPPGAGGYLLCAVLHDWGDEPARTILRHCAEAAGPHSRVFVVEKFVTDSDHRTEMDLRVLVYFGGRERDIAELTALAAAAGLRVAAVHPAGATPVVELTAV
jgi:hypothetical protein